MTDLIMILSAIVALAGYLVLCARLRTWEDWEESEDDYPDFFEPHIYTPPGGNVEVGNGHD